MATQTAREIILDVIESLAPLEGVAPSSEFTDLGTLLRAAKFQRGTTEWDRRRESAAELPRRLDADDLVHPVYQYVTWWRDRLAARREPVPDLLAAAIARLDAAD